MPEARPLAALAAILAAQANFTWDSVRSQTRLLGHTATNMAGPRRRFRILHGRRRVDGLISSSMKLAASGANAVL